MANALWIAGVDVEATLGYGIVSLPRWRDGYEVTRPTTQIPDSPVSVTGPRGYRPRTLSVTLLVGTANDTWAQRADRLDQVDALCGYGESAVSIMFGDQTDRQLIGYLVNRRVSPAGRALEWATGFAVEVTLEFLCPDPRWTAVTQSTLATIAGTLVKIPAGTAAFDARLVIGGGNGTHTVTVYNASAVAVQTMTFVATLTGQTITVRTGSVQDLDTSLATNPYALWTGWETEQFIRFDPSLWDFRGSNWAGITVSGAASASMSYTPAWRG